jgi:hypothetical protein
VKMRMPTRLRNGEGRTDGEAVDTGTRPIRRGIGHGTLEGWCRQRERPVMARVAASTSLQGGGLGRESDRVIVLLKPGNSGGGKDPDFWCADEDGEERVIGDEP